jgi:hypothetical protein
MMFRKLIWIALLAVILSACTTAGPIQVAPPTQPAAGSPAAPAVNTPVSATAVATETATALPPTVTFTPTATLPPTATATPAPYGPADFPAGVNPLTGQTVSSPALLERRPLAVKIQIYPRGQRMPWGVSLADLTFE